MAKKSSFILVFALAFTAFIVLPGFLDKPFPPYSLVHWADIFDLFTPIVIIPLYWLLFRDSSREANSTGSTITFLLLAALWVEGQAMHLSANSISNLLGQGSTDIHDLVHFYDEVLSHYIWHFAIIALSILLLSRITNPSTTTSVRWSLIGPAALLYGFTFFAAVNEGGTVPLGLPAATLIVLWILISKRRLVGTQNLVGFFFSGYLIALALLIGWYLRWGSFPEFTEVGII